MPGFNLDRIGAGLPVATLLPAFVDALASGRCVVQAPPGTGKTTLIPPAVANAVPGKVIVTQPRRVAARAAARRLASLAGVRLGEEVGFTVRGESKNSRRTRVEFVTTGVLLRRLLRDPELADVGAVVMDEVHERHLDDDLALGLLRDLIELRDDLKLVAMSATVDADRFAALLGDHTSAPVIAAESVLHPLSVEWAPPRGIQTLSERGVTRDFCAHIATTTRRAFATAEGDALVFVPGVWEVEQVTGDLAGVGVPVLPLHGRLSPREQDAALSPAEGRRIVVATSVAESSLTVPGVRLVIDSGLSREPRLDASRGLTGLVTVAEAKASAEQRAGRAARLGPGTVVRCFAQQNWAGLAERPLPELATADLTQALLDLACWGTPRGEGLRLLDPLPEASVARAERVLLGLGSLDADGTATGRGRAMAQLPAEPRLARALLDGAPLVGADTAAEVVAMLSGDERAPAADLTALLRQLRRGGPAGGRWRDESRRLRSLIDDSPAKPHRSTDEQIATVVALAYPDRLARRRDNGDAYLLTGDTGAQLPPDAGSLRGSPWLAVSELTLGRGAEAIIRAAVPISEEGALLAAASMINEGVETEWSQGRVTARKVRRAGAIILNQTPIRPSAADGQRAVKKALFDQGLGPLPWTKDATTLRRRLALLAHHLGGPWPTVDDASLLDRLDEWLGPELDQLARGKAASNIDLTSALRRLLPWPEASRFDELAPERLEVPTGSKIRIDYPADPADPPVVAVKLQECFGLTETPRLADGRAPVLFHLLSPAQRPLAVTADLASFWVNAYPGVRAENRGRYAKHPWPEDPLTAPPKRGTKRSGR